MNLSVSAKWGVTYLAGMMRQALVEAVPATELTSQLPTPEAKSKNAEMARLMIK